MVGTVLLQFCVHVMNFFFLMKNVFPFRSRMYFLNTVPCQAYWDEKIVCINVTAFIQTVPKSPIFNNLVASVKLSPFLLTIFFSGPLAPLYSSEVWYHITSTTLYPPTIMFFSECTAVIEYDYLCQSMLSSTESDFLGVK